MRITGGFIVLFVLLFAGCEGLYEDFVPCSLDPKVQELGQCESTGDEGDDSITSQNCAIADHPHCPVGVCLAWEGDVSYCTVQCVDDSDCAEGSSCKLYSTAGESDSVVRYCVRDIEEEAQ
mgnify:CR=1 FL=1